MTLIDLFWAYIAIGCANVVALSWRDRRRHGTWVGATDVADMCAFIFAGVVTVLLWPGTGFMWRDEDTDGE